MIKVGVVSLVVLLLAVPVSVAAGDGTAAGSPVLVVRLDDVGMSHTSNEGLREVLAAGIPVSASVMFACPWYLEAVEIFKAHPEISVGIHLTLNSEWSHYKWGPVTGRTAVPTLVDENGHFHASAEAFAAAGVDPREVRTELRAQIERALGSGVPIDYVDAHMLMAYSTGELRAIVEELAKEYGLAVSMYFGEYSGSLWDVQPEHKLAGILTFLNSLRPGLNLLVIHPGGDSPEMTAMVDTNYAPDPFRVGRHRQAEIDALTSAAFSRAVDDLDIRLATYREVISERGLQSQQRPENTDGYAAALRQD